MLELVESNTAMRFAVDGLHASNLDTVFDTVLSGVELTKENESAIALETATEHATKPISKREGIWLH